MEDAYRGMLARYHDGELSEDAARELELHLARCEACQEELAALRMLSTRLAAAEPNAEPNAGATAGAEAEAFWQRVQPRLGQQHAPVPWRSWLPGLFLLALQGLLAVGLTLSGLAGVSVHLPEIALPIVPLPGAPLPLMPLSGAAASVLLSMGLVGSVGVLYLVWLAVWWSRAHAAVDSAGA